MGGPRILVVDDDAEMRAYLRSCLGLLTSDVVEASDGAQALALLQEKSTPSIAMVITDVAMPVMDGMALRNAMAEDSILKRVPVLLVTAEFDPDQAGDTPVLLKPFNGRLLRAYVQDLCPDSAEFSG